MSFPYCSPPWIMCSIIIFKGTNILKQLEVPQQGKASKKTPLWQYQGIPSRHEENEGPDFWIKNKSLSFFWQKRIKSQQTLQISRGFFIEFLALCAIFHGHVSQFMCTLLLCGTGCTGDARQESWWVQMLLKAPQNSLSLPCWRCSSNQGDAAHQGAQGTAQTPKPRGQAVRIGQINRGVSFHQPLLSLRLISSWV